jgi:hypothetical protein
MNTTPLLGAAALLTVAGWLWLADAPPQTATPRTAPAQPVADGHYVLVVEGDRTALLITHASRKTEPWAGVPKGFTSAWLLSIRDAHGAVLADVPLDVTPVATGAGELGKPVRVEGCIVRDSRIAMLVNVPRFAAAASYTFTRVEGGRTQALGAAAGQTVRELGGEIR